MDTVDGSGNGIGATSTPGIDGATGSNGSDGGDLDGLIIIDPTSGRSAGGSSDSGSGGTGRRRGRPPGSSGKTATGKTALDGIDIRVLLVGIHGMLAVKLEQPHWALEDDEAKQVENAIKRVMRHQDMNVSQKQIDYLFAGYVVAMVYGTRLAASFLGKKPEAETPETTVAAPGVFQFPQPGIRPG